MNKAWCLSERLDNNIKKMKVCMSEEAAYWYRYITTCTLLNCWDGTCAALNGCDKDGDLIFLTDNRILVENIRPTRTIFCIQRNAEKVEPTEDTQIRSNLASFGDDIGKTTNKVTAMYDVQSYYPKDSAEYETLEYRIQSGQLYQQNQETVPSRSNACRKTRLTGTSRVSPMRLTVEP